MPLETIPDIIESTLDDLRPMTLTDLSTDTVEHVGFNRLMQQSSVTSQSGKAVRINLMTKFTSNARFKAPYETDGSSVQEDVLDHGSVPWRLSDFFWSWQEDEIDINEGEARIQDYVKTKRDAALIGWAEFIETWFWGVPPATSDDKKPFNLRYWLQKSTTTGFNGLVPTGADSIAYTSVGNISPALYPRWANYTVNFADHTEEDLVAKWRTAMRQTNFKPPIGVSMNNMFGSGSNYAHFTNEFNYSKLQSFADRRNDNLGFDFAGRAIAFQGAPVEWAPRLDRDTDNPIYSLNFNKIKVVYLKGKWMKERAAKEAPLQHGVWQVWVDSRWNMICSDRRSQIVLSQSNSYTGN